MNKVRKRKIKHYYNILKLGGHWDLSSDKSFLKLDQIKDVINNKVVDVNEAKLIFSDEKEISSLYTWNQKNGVGKLISEEIVGIFMRIH